MIDQIKNTLILLPQFSKLGCSTAKRNHQTLLSPCCQKNRYNPGSMIFLPIGQGHIEIILQLMVRVCPYASNQKTMG